MGSTNLQIQKEYSIKNTIGLQKCRLCLTTEEENLLELCSKQALELNIVSKLNKFCNLNISKGDCLPMSICFFCLNEIARFSDFYTRVQENQKLLLTKARVFSKEDIEIVTNVYDEDQTIESGSEANFCKIKICPSDDYSESGGVFQANSQSDNDEDTLNNLSLSNEDNTQPGDDKNSTNNLSNSNNILKEETVNSERITPFHKDISDSVKPLLLKSGNAKSVKRWLKRTMNSKSKECVKDLLTDYNAKAKILILPPRKSHHRIALDDPIREFFDLSCPRCDFAFVTFVTLKKHMENDHNERGFIICCNKKFYRREAVMEHITFHVNPKKFVCHLCQLVCKSKVTLKVHLKQHMPEDQRPFSCQTCGQRFVLNSQLKSHEKSHLSEDEKKYVCEQCGKAFAFKFVLEAHKQHMHIREKNFMCEICARSFINKVNLTAHKRTHDETLPRLKCSHCGALLKNKITLKIHMRTHNPEIHSCSKCDKILATKNALMNHKLYVHGGKRYPCTVCQKVFKKPLTLKEHMAIHTGEILYECEHCGKSFKAKANMYSHVKKVHTTEWAEQRKLKRGTLS